MSEPNGHSFDTEPERIVFGSRFCGPDRLPLGAWVRVAEYIPPNDHGRAVRVYARATPERSYRLIAAGIHLSTGTGSDLGMLLRLVARAVADGSLAAGPTPSAPRPTSGADRASPVGGA